jgi:predicted Zn finger-like uncharacterized protein
MSLITRCPACGTMFKVVADQLKISQGWVRCGQCSDVFDAAAHLQPRASTPAPHATAPANGIEQPSTEAQYAEPAATLATRRAAPEIAAAPAPPAPPPPEPQEAELSVPEIQVSMPPDLAAEVFESSMNPYAYVLPDPPTSAAQESNSEFGESEMPRQEASPVGSPDVSFVRDARRQAFWRRPLMRWSLGGTALLLLLALLLQAALFQRSALAAREGSLQTGLQALCGYLRCDIPPLRQIESIVIDSSSFSKIAADAYRLKVVIKNTGAVALAMPSLELTLTDSQDQALLRRVLAPRELGADAATVAAGSEFSGELAISISNPVPAPVASASQASAPKPSGPLRIAGYRVLAFYP